ncbi:MAG: MATE family efflux transporter [Lachnospiraceae bacterium]|nr:MATE family efflux transporter [Lachnospiraceae bacterium]
MRVGKLLSETDTRQQCLQMLREFFPLLIALSLTTLLSLAVNLVDNFMLGRYSEQTMAAAALVNQIQFLLHEITIGIGAGVSVLGSQYWGKKETGPIKKVMSIGLKFGIGAGLLFTVVTAAIPEKVLFLFTNDAALVDLACDYLGIMCWTYLIFGMSSALMFSMQAVESAVIGTVMSAFTIVINATLNYIFIFGNFGAPELGIKGAAVATVTSRIVELITILVYILVIDKKLHTTVSDLIHTDLTYFGDFAKAAVPVMVSGAIWGLGQACQTAILGHISESAIAANSIALIFAQLIGSFGMSCGAAASVTMGKTVGSGKRELIKPFTITLQLAFLAIGVASGTVILLCRNLIVNLYVLSGETRELTLSFLIIFGITIMGSIYEYPVQGGIIAGGGNPRYQVIIDNIGIWCWTIPFAYLSAFVFGWSPVVTFFILKSDQLLKCIPNSIYCNSYKWVRDLTR